MARIRSILADVKKKWDCLDATVRSIFAKKLKERLEQLSGIKDCYKIKLLELDHTNILSECKWILERIVQIMPA